MNKKSRKLLTWCLVLCMVLTQMLFTNVAFAATKLSGSDRYQTAIEIVKAGWTKSDAAVIARGDDLADALAAAPLAYAKGKAPILLTQTNALPAGVLDELKALGVKNVYIVGGTGAVSTAVEDALKAEFTVKRLAGTDRFATALAVANEAFPTAPSKVVLVNGYAYADALSVSSIAAYNGMPILLVDKNAVTPEVSAYLTGKTVYAVGGTGVISDAVAGSATRLAGADRYATNVEVLKAFDLDYNKVYVAVGEDDNAVDALGGAALAAVGNNPIFLVNGTLLDNAKTLLTGKVTSDTVVYTLGGVVPSSVAATIEGLKPTTLKLDSVSVVAANQLKIVFNKAVDTTKASFLVKNDYVPVDVTAKFSDDAKSVTLTADNNFVAGNYTVTVKGLTDTDLVSDPFKIEAQKMVSFTIKTTQLLANTNPQDLIYEAIDQYGNVFDYPSTNFTPNAYNVTTETNTATIANGINKFTITLTNPTVKDNIVITLVDKATGMSQLVTLPVVADSLASSMTFGTPVPKTNNTRIYTNEVAVDNLYIPFAVKDQYNNAMALNLADYTFISSNTAIVNPTSFALYDADGDGSKDSINFATGATSGTVTITAVSLKTGKTATVTFTVYDPAALKSVSFAQPAGLIVANESTTINYTALDTFGASTKLTAVGDLTWFSTNPSVVKVPDDLNVDSKGILTVKPRAAGTTVLSAFLGGVKQGDITIVANAAAVETKITKVLPTALTYFAKTGGTYTYKVADFEIIDQYNRVIAAPTGTVALTVKDGTTNVVNPSGATLTSGGTVGTKTVTVTYTNGDITLTKDFTVNVIDDTAVKGYELAPITNTVLYANNFANVSAAGNYARQFVINNGLDANNNKVALSPADAASMVLTNSNTAAVTVDPATNKVFAKGAVDKGTATVTAWKNGVKIADVNFTTSTATPDFTTLSFAKDTYTVTMSATFDLKNELTTNGKVLDQYGVTLTIEAGAWFSQDTTIATVNANGVVTGVKAGTTTIIFVAPNGANVSVKVTVE